MIVGSLLYILYFFLTGCRTVEFKEMSTVRRKSFLYNIIIIFLWYLPVVSPTTPTIAPSYLRSNQNLIKTTAGNGDASSGANGGPATATGLNYPRSVSSDPSGNIYWSEQNGNCIRRYGASNNIVSAFAGQCGYGGTTGDGGAATSALINVPVSIIFDTAGTLYFCDFSNNRIRRVVSNAMQSFAFTGSSGNTGDGGAATAAAFTSPHGVWVSSLGVVYVSSVQISCVRSVSTTGIVTNFAGTGTSGFGGDGGAATSGLITSLERLAGDTQGRVYIADIGNFRIRAVSAGIITTVAGNGVGANNGDGLPGTSTSLNYATGHVVDPNNGDLYIALINDNKVRVLSGSSAVFSTFAGTGNGSPTPGGSNGDGGAATSCTFGQPDGLFVDGTTHDLYVVDRSNNKIRKVYTIAPSVAPTIKPTMQPTVSPTSLTPTIMPSQSPSYRLKYVVTVAGSGDSFGSAVSGGRATSTYINLPRSVWMDTVGYTYFTQYDNACVRRFAADTIVTNFAGICNCPDYIFNEYDAATSVCLQTASDVIVDTSGVAYVSDFGGNQVHRVSLSGAISVTAGTGSGGDGDGVATATDLSLPYGLFKDTLGVLYIACLGQSKVRTVSVSGILTVFAGSNVGTGGDGGPSTLACLSYPQRVVGDTQGNVYISDTSNNVIRLVSTSGIISTLIGSGFSGSFSMTETNPVTVNVGDPKGLAVDSATGDLYVAVSDSKVIVKYSPSMFEVTLFAGGGDSTMDNLDATATNLGSVDGLFLNPDGTLYYVDSDGEVVRKIVTLNPTRSPSVVPSAAPSVGPTTTRPSVVPTAIPSVVPSVGPSTIRPSIAPSVVPTVMPSAAPSVGPTTISPSVVPTAIPSVTPSVNPTTIQPSITPSIVPTVMPSAAPSVGPTTIRPSIAPSVVPTAATQGPTTLSPTRNPTQLPSSFRPTAAPTTAVPTLYPSKKYIMTVAGGAGPTAIDANRKATSAYLSNPKSVWLDTVGYVYIALQTGSCIKRYSTSNEILVDFAGVCYVTNPVFIDGIAATASQVFSVTHLLVDTVGVTYFSDYVDNRVRRVTVSGIMLVVAGTGMPGDESGVATSSAIASPVGVYKDTAGLVYVSLQWMINRVRKIDASGIISVFAGVSSYGNYDGDLGAATAASLNAPESLTGDTLGNVFIGDSGNNLIRKVDISGIISTYLGGGGSYNPEVTNPTCVGIMYPGGIAIDSTTGDMYVALVDDSFIVLYSKAIQSVTLFAGVGDPNAAISNTAVMDATSAGVGSPDGIYLTTDGTLYLADMIHFVIRKVFSMLPTAVPTRIPTTPSPSLAPSLTPSAAPSTLPSVNPSVVPTAVPTSAPSRCPTTIAPSSIAPTAVPSAARSAVNSITTVAGTGLSQTSGTGGLATAASFNSPRSVWQDTMGYLYIGEDAGNCIRRFSTASANIVEAYAGVCGVSAFSGDGGPASNAYLSNPVCIFIDSQARMYIVDAGNARVRMVLASGPIQTIAGSGSAVNDNAPATSANIGNPIGVWADTSGVLYIVEFSNNAVRSVSSSGIISLFAGRYVQSYSGDGGPATQATFQMPDRVRGDTLGNVYISDTLNNRVRLVTGGIITTFMGSGLSTFYENAPATATGINFPEDMEIDSQNGDFYVAARDNQRIHVLTRSSGLVSNFVGSGGTGSAGDGGAATAATLDGPDGLFLNTLGYLYIGQVFAKYVRMVYPVVPSIAPTALPTSVKPSVLPTLLPTSGTPSLSPSLIPTYNPTLFPSINQTASPSVTPSLSPSQVPSPLPSMSPSVTPSASPSYFPSIVPSVTPASSPSVSPTALPSLIPSVSPFALPTVYASASPSLQPSLTPTCSPTLIPSINPSASPSMTSLSPSVAPSTSPSYFPSIVPSGSPTALPSLVPSVSPSALPTFGPSAFLNLVPSASPSLQPSLIQSESPTCVPSALPSTAPTLNPTLSPSEQPSVGHFTIEPSVQPSEPASRVPTNTPSTSAPSVAPSEYPTLAPSRLPSLEPILAPSNAPTEPTVFPSLLPSLCPSLLPSNTPTAVPSVFPTAIPSLNPSEIPSTDPSVTPSAAPTVSPSICPSGALFAPSHFPTLLPTSAPSTFKPSATPSVRPSVKPTLKPTPTPSRSFLASLPANNTISVLGSAQFKIILPLTVSLTSSSTASVFSDIRVPSSGSLGSAHEVPGTRTKVSSIAVDESLSPKFVNVFGLDEVKRTVSPLKDVNGDGIDDLIIGDPFASRCYVLFGNAGGYMNMSDGFSIFGEQASDLTGWSVSGAGDVNNDTIADIIIGAPNARGVGAFYVVFGRVHWFDVYLRNITSIQGFAVFGTQKSDYLGVSVNSAGDVNKDGCSDIIAGALLTSNLISGCATVLFGCQQSIPISIAGVSDDQGFKMVGAPFSYTGAFVSGAGDVNGDGYDEVLIGSNPVSSSLIAPSVFLVYGSANVTNALQLSALTADHGIHILGGGPFAFGVGDTNGDGLSDVVIASAGTSFAINAGLVLLTDVSLLTRLTDPPSEAPTVVPSTTRPSLSIQPSATPTFAATRPTVEPTMGGTGPTSRPSSQPSAPSVVPSRLPTRRPSKVPTVVPSVTPSEVFTLSPSVVPSLSRAPTTGQPMVVTRSPVFSPTLRPTVTQTTPPTAAPASVVVQYVNEPNSVLNITNANVQLVVNTSGSVSVVGSGGRRVYVLFPTDNSTLSIAQFNQSGDVIDLRAFTYITEFKQLKLSEGSVLVTLSLTQFVHILNLHIPEVSSRNFLFHSGETQSRLDDTQILVIKVISGVAVGVVCLIAVFMLRRGVLKIKKQYEIAPQSRLYLVIRTTVDGRVLDNWGVAQELEPLDGDLSAVAVSSSDDPLSLSLHQSQHRHPDSFREDSESVPCPADMVTLEDSSPAVDSSVFTHSLIPGVLVLQKDVLVKSRTQSEDDSVFSFAESEGASVPIEDKQLHLPLVTVDRIGSWPSVGSSDLESVESEAGEGHESNLNSIASDDDDDDDDDSGEKDESDDNTVSSDYMLSLSEND